MEHESLAHTHGFVPARVEGTLPQDLRGTLYSTGPALFSRGGTTLSHPFLADGAVYAVRFDAGRVEHAARFVETERFVREQQAGRFLYAEGAKGLRRLWHGLFSRPKSTGNTSLWRRDDHLFALMEAGLPVQMDPSTLQTLGERQLGCIERAFSAHPHEVPSRQTTFNFGVRYGIQMHIDIFAFPRGEECRRFHSFATPWATLVHDFICTEEHLVFYISPAVLRPLRAMLGWGGLADWFGFEPQRGGVWVVIPIDDPQRMWQVQGQPWWIWHFANAFDVEDGIEIDVVTHPDLGTLSRLSEGGTGPAPRLRRIRIDAHGEHHRWQADIGGEFPRIAAGARCARTKDVWTTAYPLDRASEEGTGLARVSIEDGEVDRWQAPSSIEATEPIRDDSGRWILSLLHDQQRQESCVGIFEADQMGDGPRARVWLGQRIPITYHGLWWPAA